MPLTPSYGDRRIGPVTRLYRRTERALLELLAKAMAPGVGHVWVWANRLLMRLPTFRRRVNRVITDADRDMPRLVTDALLGAWRDGITAARSDLPSAPTVDASAVQRLINDTITTIRSTHTHVPSVMEGGYRSVIDATVRAEQAAGTIDRAQVVQRALEQFARQGITGFVDRRGYRYDLVSYVEIAVRSAITRAEVDAYCAQATAAGHDLVVVSDVPGACELCRPFEGAVISISGATVGAIAREASTGRSVTVTVMCSLEQARARGLWHRACRHTLKVWTPDDPAPPRAVRVPDDVRATRRRQRSLARRDRVRQRIRFVAQS
ncbi:phage minor capsid protein [Nocardia asiatica]|uniref:phage minor capsid protein n=1 Tax=Nocardia asiatica TaxID=209252 RepID=UPI002456EF15|nr:phage minor capsid protein [Nocardia asiatica]